MNPLASQSAAPDTHFHTLRQTRSMFSSLAELILHSYRGSLLRLTLRGLRSCYHRIRFERSIRGTLRFDVVRRCVPQVPCSDSRNELQFCSRSIQSLEQVRPYMTIADAEVFLQGWFQAVRWYAHLDSESRRSQQGAYITATDNGFVRSDRSLVRTVLESVPKPDARQYPASQPVVIRSETSVAHRTDDCTGNCTR
jgi:hypothetical protein